MNEIQKMLFSLTVICASCALALSGFKAATNERIINQVLVNEQGPKVKILMAGADNETALIEDRKTIEREGKDAPIFIGKKDGKTYAIAYETTGKGFGGEITVMTAYDIETGDLIGVQIIKHSETPGIGSKIEGDSFTSRFNNQPRTLNFNTKADGGDIDAISGATVSSRGVCAALHESVKLFDKMKKQAQK